MPLVFICSYCGQPIVVRHLSVGDEAHCKACGNRTPVPATAVNADDAALAEVLDKRAQNRGNGSIPAPNWRPEPELATPTPRPIEGELLVKQVSGLLYMSAFGVIAVTGVLVVSVPGMSILKAVLGALFVALLALARPLSRVQSDRELTDTDYALVRSGAPVRGEVVSILPVSDGESTHPWSVIEYGPAPAGTMTFYIGPAEVGDVLTVLCHRGSAKPYSKCRYRAAVPKPMRTAPRPSENRP